MMILVCGGRDYHFRDRVFETLDRVRESRPVTAVVEGGCTGADALAAEWALSRGVQLVECPANWEAHGNRAGPMRNQFMASLNPAGVVAFGGGRGTAGMVDIARREGIKVMEVDKDGRI